jgi:cell division protein FtsQ
MSQRTSNRKRTTSLKSWLPSISFPGRGRRAKSKAAKAAKAAGREGTEKRSLREHPALILASWLIPVAGALTAFASPFLGVRVHEYIMETGHFFVREVHIEGQERLDESDVLAVARIEAGTHVLSADLDAMEKRLENDPWIAKARVHRQLPDRLSVLITEHHPVAFVALDELMLVGADGEPFAVPGPEDDLQLPIVSGIPAESFLHPSLAAVARADIRAAVNLVRLYESMGFTNRWPVGEVRVSSGRKLTLVLSGLGTEVTLGTGPYRQKLYRLEWVLEMLHSRGKVADYVLLDGTGPTLDGRDDGRVVLRADLARDDEAAADAASRRASEATSLDAGRDIIELAPDPSWGLSGEPRAHRDPLLPGFPGESHAAEEAQP